MAINGLGGNFHFAPSKTITMKYLPKNDRLTVIDQGIKVNDIDSPNTSLRFN
ncbi:hypothetical protein [Desulfosporosinus sp. OT]|uniref:hypothetical protein n=1 Tax=Desulfosporosinus sp. OT TaxID=913865 RepID=UPI000223A7AD|nr:hypothetical protein [Desulfosporosinus sp. OT]EGW37775.1 hypothetical protein DOT_4168 [Desulfosporosinus sp. OT]